jgi:hypothetical protein
MAYFIRRSGDNCSVIQLDPDDREEGDRDRRRGGSVRKQNEGMRISPGQAWPDTASAPRPRLEKHGGRQLAFRFD